MSGVMSLGEKKSKAPKDLGLFEFNKILDCTVEELLEKAYNEEWQVKHIEFWLKVKNAQNFELIKIDISDIREILEQKVMP